MLTQSDAAVLQQVAEMVEHGALVLAADATKIAQETAAVGHHLGETDLLLRDERASFTSLTNVPPHLPNLYSLAPRLSQGGSMNQYIRFCLTDSLKRGVNGAKVHEGRIGLPKLGWHVI